MDDLLCDLLEEPMKYKVGDWVRVKENLEPGRDYGGRVADRYILPYKGQVHMVSKISSVGTYYLLGTDSTFSEKMLERPFKVNDLVCVEGEMVVIKDFTKNYSHVIDLDDNKYPINKVSLVFVEKSNNSKIVGVYENRLQEQSPHIGGGTREKGSRVFGRRPKVKVPIGLLRRQTRISPIKSWIGRCKN